MAHQCCLPNLNGCTYFQQTHSAKTYKTLAAQQTPTLPKILGHRLDCSACTCIHAKLAPIASAVAHLLIQFHRLLIHLGPPSHGPSLTLRLPVPAHPPPALWTQIAVVVFSQNRTFRAFSDTYHYAIDTGIGYTMFAIMGMLSFVGFVGALQMKMLFNDSFSEK
eukprot:scaffold322635_cov18-Tisochrysis_lutea.AAC.2